MRLAILVLSFAVGFVAIAGARRGVLFCRDGGAASSTLNSGLTAYWKLDETSGNRSDSSGNGYTLTDNNTVGNEAGVISNGSTAFASASEYLSHADTAALSMGAGKSMTFAAWVRPHAPGGFSFVVGNWIGWYLAWGNSGTEFLWYVDYTSSTAFLTSGNAFPSNTWHHVAITFDSASKAAKMYTNGVVGPTLTLGDDIKDGAQEFQLHAVSSASVYSNLGIDEAGYWDHALSASEISELYNSGSGKTCCPF